MSLLSFQHFLYTRTFLHVYYLAGSKSEKEGELPSDIYDRDAATRGASREGLGCTLVSELNYKSDKAIIKEDNDTNVNKESDIPFDGLSMVIVQVAPRIGRYRLRNSERAQYSQVYCILLVMAMIHGSRRLFPETDRTLPRHRKH